MNGRAGSHPGTVTTSRPGDGILWVRIDHPPVNALAAPVRAGLIRAASEAQDASVRVVVLTGNDHCFSAGGDIDELASLTSDEDAQAVHGEYLDVYRSWRAIHIPTIAAIRGYALGGALELALSCDLRYAEPDAFFAASGAKMGLVESAHSLPTVIGATAAAEMLFTAGRVSAHEAYDSGLVTRVLSDLDSGVLGVAGAIAARPPEAILAIKATMRVAETAGRGEAGDMATGLWRVLRGRPAHQAAAAAFLARRTTD
jgi:enoyl-CoA hydratase/carnithine racemase